ncbi:hypothetical protein EZS27_033370, partial [termite gut metagenome]
KILPSLSIVRIIGKVMMPLFHRKNIYKPRRRLSPLKITTVESGISWQDSNEKESATAKLNT